MKIRFNFDGKKHGYFKVVGACLRHYAFGWRSLGCEGSKCFSALDETIKQERSELADFKVVNKSHSFTTKGEIDFIDLSSQIQEDVAASGVRNGVAHIFAPHATGILILTENDPALLNDIKALLEEMAPSHRPYQHPQNAHSHLRSIMFPPDKTLPIIDGQALFGTWQSLLFVETDVYPRKRTIIVQIIGEQ